MKTKFLFFVATLLCVSAFSQTKPGKQQTEPMPTQEELQSMMKEIQAGFENLDPETRRIMDSMGVKMPSFQGMPDLSNAQLQEAYKEQGRLVPSKDVNRIAALPKAPLTSASIALHITGVHKNVSAKLKPASKVKGEEIYQALHAEDSSPLFIGNSASALWMIGKTELALYVMGRVCADNPQDGNLLNNYASMLSMSGAEHLAIPLLSFVNKRFPRNSTVLNNLGQAWFGLGDIAKASSYLDSAIRLFPGHAQANFTRSFIEESKNNRAGAIEAVKRSMKNGFSMEKQSRLSDLGYDIKPDDIPWHEPMPQDPLGLEKFVWPSYPEDVMDSERSEKAWQIFKESCSRELESLRAQATTLEKVRAEKSQQRMRQAMAASNTGQFTSMVPLMAFKAAIKLGHLVNDKDGSRLFAMQSKQQALLDAAQRVENMKMTLAENIRAVNDDYKDLFGEGKANPFDQACEAENGVLDKFLKNANGLLEEVQRDYLNFLRRKLNNEVYYNQYAQWEDEFELTKVNAKISWIAAIQAQRVEFRNKSKWCQRSTLEPARPFVLAAFDDVNCKYHSELVTPVGTIRTDCSRVTTTLDLKLVKLGLKQDMEKETFGDQFMTCSVEVGVGTGVGVNAGPIKAEASIGGGVRAEFDRNGLSDLVLKGGASVEVGSDLIKGGSMAGVGVSDLSADVGVTGQISLVSGKSSITGGGLLSSVGQR